MENANDINSNKNSETANDNTNEEKAREQLFEYKERTGKTQTEIAKELDISNSQLSQFLKGVYKAPHVIIPKVMQLVDINIKKEIAPREPGFCRTTISGTVMDLIAYCHIQRKIGVAYGDAGVGKTMAIREYQRQNPDTAIVVTISPCFATMTGVNELIAEELRIREKISRKIYAEAVHVFVNTAAVFHDVTAKGLARMARDMNIG